MRRGSHVKALPLLLLCLALPSCGGSGEGSATDTAQSPGQGQIAVHATAISKADFIKQASSICLAAKKRTSKEFETYLGENKVPSGGPGMIAKAEDVVETVFAPIYTSQITQIRALGAPRDDVKQVGAILTAMSEGIQQAKLEPLKFIQKGTALNKASKAVVAYGMPACSNGNV